MTYSKTNPFLSILVDRHSLCKIGSDKETRHVVLDLKGSGLIYEPGDSVGVFPENIPENVYKTLEAAKMKGDEVIVDKKTGASIALWEFLTKRASIKGFSRKFIHTIEEKTGRKFNDPKIIQEHYEVWDLLQDNPDAFYTPQEFADLLMPLMPRFYSIASSQKIAKEEVHLTVAHLKYTSNQHERVGVCTHYLCALAPMNAPVVPIFIQPSHGFKLVSNPETPIIMIGPGTGVAPFRAFMQERQALGHTGKNWLFFGERTRAHEYYYEEEWKQYPLDIDLAFSRDQDQKVYVQDKMLEKGARLFRWLEEGAVIYVCGDAQRMAKDVDKTLHMIIEKYGSCYDPAEYLKALKHQNRYQRDIY